MAKFVRRVQRQIRALQLGDLVRVRWFDACKGEARIDEQSASGKEESSSSMQFDIPVTSWGVFLGLVGEKTRHVLLIRDHFQMNAASGVYDIDYSVVPVGMIQTVEVLKKGELETKVAGLLQQAFLKARTSKRKGRIILHLSQREEEVDKY
jgi:hypothetical protein